MLSACVIFLRKNWICDNLYFRRRRFVVESIDPVAGWCVGEGYAMIRNNHHNAGQIHKYKNVQRHRYTNAQILKYVKGNTQIHKYTNTQVRQRKYANTQIHKYTNIKRKYPLFWRIPYKEGNWGKISLPTNA